MFDVKSKFSLLAYIRLSTERRNVDNHYSVSHNQLTNACERQAIIEKAASARAAAEPLTLTTARSHFVRMPIALPLTVSRFRNSQGEVVSIIIRDAVGRSIHINCDPSDFRRTASRVWSPEDAEALAKWIARHLSDEIAMRARIAEHADPTSWAYKKNVSP